jgi:hypothetical protein
VRHSVMTAFPYMAQALHNMLSAGLTTR